MTIPASPPDRLGLVPHRQLASMTTLELGGAARWFLEAESESRLLDALAWAKEGAIPVLLLGGGSNVVIADSGFDGLVARIATRGIEIAEEPGGTRLVTAAAGEVWDELVSIVARQGLTGLECLSGIPGSVGATPVQNVGAYGEEVSRRLVQVRAWDRESGRVTVIDGQACEFGYRTSRFRREPGRFAILDVAFRVEAGESSGIRSPELAGRLEARAKGASPVAVREAVLELRRSKSMLIDLCDENRRSVGSFFLNPLVTDEERDELIRRAIRGGVVSARDELPCWPAEGGKTKLSAAWLIEKAGFPKGLRRGAVGISTKHSLALVHHGGGSARELLALAEEIRTGVDEKWGIRLEPEPVFAGFPSPSPD